ncbi:MAG TPA: hypothetical protein VGA36_03585 [Nitriliruptorales bacterium]
MASTNTLAHTSDRSGLGRLDDAVVPKLQAGARTTAQVAAMPLRSVVRAEDAVAGAAARWGVRHRRALVLLATTLAVAGSWIHFQRYPEIQQAQAEQTVSRPGEATGSRSDALAGGAQVVGPVSGEGVRSYIDDRHAELAALPADETRLAVISFAEYVTPEEALVGVPAGARIHVAQLRIPAAGEEPFQTEVADNDVIGSIERGLAAPMAAFAEEEAALEELIPTVTDPEFKTAYERDLEELRVIRNLVNSGAGTVFAVVVEAPVRDLQALLALDSVRLVDVAPGEAHAASSGFFGLLPEDRDVVTYGNRR